MKFAAVGIASGLSGSGNLVGCGQCNIPCETLVLKLEVMMIEVRKYFKLYYIQINK